MIDRRRAALPLPPSVNHAYRHSRGQVRLSETARQWRDHVQAVVPCNPLPDGPICVRITFIRSRQDVDNGIKAVLDALQGLWWTNDRDVVWLLATKSNGPDAGIIVEAWASAGKYDRVPKRRRVVAKSPWAALIQRPPLGGGKKSGDSGHEPQLG